MPYHQIISTILLPVAAEDLRDIVYISEKSYNEEMKKYTIGGKLFAVIGKNINNRLAVFSW